MTDETESLRHNGEHARATCPSNGQLRVGGVVYLNARPLLYHLPRICPDAIVHYDVPSQLAVRLARRELDIAIVPVVEAFRSPDYVVVSDACIAAADAARSVLVFSRVPLEKVTTLALDVGSRTSAAVIQILLAERYGIRPRILPLPFQQTPTELSCDAVLMIGDRAMTTQAAPFQRVYDLGLEWRSWTGLPLVFAVWVAQPARRDWADVARLFAEARDRGVTSIGEIAAESARELKLPFEVCYEYLSRNLHYKLGSAEYESLSLFAELAAKHGFIPPGASLKFQCQQDPEPCGVRRPLD